MKTARVGSTLVVILLTLGAHAWGHYPARVDMAASVPAAALGYVELNDLPAVVSGVTKADGWGTLFEGSELASGLFRSTWLTWVARWTGIGSAEQVIIARSQVGLVVLAFDKTDDQATLRIRPAAALIIETHTTGRWMKATIENRVAEVASRVYPLATAQRKTIDGIESIKWISPKDGQGLFATFHDSVAIIGNDERAVQACVDVRRGLRPSLIDNNDLRLLRDELRSESAAAFGYISSTGLGQLIASFAPLYLERLSDSPEAQQILTALTSRIFQNAGWAARFQAGSIEDRYVLMLSPNQKALLREAFATAGSTDLKASGFLPKDTFTFTHYKFTNARLAWLGLNKALSSQVEVLGAVLVGPILKATLYPYGIDDPDSFLAAVGSEIVTARLDEDEMQSILIVGTKDEPTLRKLVNDRLGSALRTERVADYEVLMSSAEDGLAASFADGRLLIGSSDALRRCLIARSQGSTLDVVDLGRRTSQFQTAGAFAVTYFRDVKAKKELVLVIKGSQFPIDGGSISSSQIPYGVSATASTDVGLEKRTRSMFGLFGTLAIKFAPEFSNK